MTATETFELREARVLLVGDDGVGKTALHRCLTMDRFDALNTTATHAPLTMPLPVHTRAAEDLHIEVSDLGPARFGPQSLSAFFSEGCVYVLVFSSTQDHPERWLSQIRASAPHSPIIVATSRIDMAPPPDPASLRALLPACFDYVATSVKAHQGIDALIAAILRAVRSLPHIGARLPSALHLVRRDLRELPERAGYLLAYDDYHEICHRRGLDERDADRLIEHFVRMGILLHAGENPILRHTLILRQSLILEAAERLEEDQRNRTSDGPFRLHDLERVLGADHVSTANSLDILQAMILIGICVPLGWDDAYLLLTRDWRGPFFRVSSDAHSPDLTFDYDRDIPPTLVPNLLGASYELMVEGEVQPHAFVVRMGDTKATLMRYGRQSLRVSIDGPARRDMLAFFHRTMRGIHAMFESLHVVETVSCYCTRCGTDLERDRLLAWQASGKAAARCPVCDTPFAITDIIADCPVEEDPAEPLRGPLRVFLASNRELRRERVLVQRLVDRENRELGWKSCRLELVIWEQLLARANESASIEGPIQEYFNRELVKCDIAVCLFHTIVGEFTLEEFELALSRGRHGEAPHRLIVLFKQDAARGAPPDPRLEHIRERLEGAPGVALLTFSTGAQLVDVLRTALRQATAEIAGPPI